MAVMDEDAVIAAVHLVDRCGATAFDYGYAKDTPRSEDAQWWAKAEFGVRAIMVKDYRSPVEAIEGLARRLMDGAMCKCGKQVALEGADPAMCRWTRNGRSWDAGCDAPPITVEGAERGNLAAVRAAAAQRHPLGIADLQAREARRG